MSKVSASHSLILLLASCVTAFGWQAADAPRDQTTTPRLLRKVEPEYSKEARAGKLSGRVLLSIVVDEKGVPKDIHVISPLGEGLDEKAIEAVSKWRFWPATRNGIPIATKAQVEVNFRLCTDCGSVPDFSRAEEGRMQYNLGIHKLRGDLDGKPDQKGAFESMEKAAAMGFAPAETMLGRFYLSGMGVPTDKAKGIEWLDKAGFDGDAGGEYQLGNLYRLGDGVSRDPALAVKYFSRAAAKDLADAECALGIAFETGEGVPQDLGESVKWYRKSAEQAFPLAEYRLSKLLWSGAAGKQDQAEALEWALLAERSGAKEAASQVREYRNNMTPGQIEKAEKRADRFKKRAPGAKK